jgi:hypothetical protein
MKTPKKGISCDKSPKNAMSCEVIFITTVALFWNLVEDAPKATAGAALEAVLGSTPDAAAGAVPKPHLVPCQKVSLSKLIRR